MDLADRLGLGISNQADNPTLSWGSLGKAGHGDFTKGLQVCTPKSSEVTKSLSLNVHDPLQGHPPSCPARNCSELR